MMIVSLSRSMARQTVRSTNTLRSKMPALIASSPTARSRLHVSAAGREVIASDKAPTPLGPYSQAIKVDSTLYISGQIGLDPAVMKNMGAVLEAAGANWGSIAKTTILLADMGDFAKVNAIYGEYFKTDPPARACYAAKTLPADALVEIEAIAHV